ncbi:MAG: type IV toxin-antitoxin system AbiEi family antitoxin domain-containing protein [Thermoanaerobaculia bacterium]
MPRVVRSPESTPEIVAEALRKAGRTVYSETQLSAAIGEVLESIGSSHRPREILGKLRDAGSVTEIVLKSADYAPFRRFAVGPPSPFELGLSLRGGAYLSHAAAVFLLGLNDQLPKTLYVNKEQTPKPVPSTPLAQDRIDRAFRASPRRSNYVYRYGETQYVLLSGKNTRDFGVEERRGPNGEPLRVTGLERTLVDIAVRPTYSGGVFQVLDAYRTAAGRLSVARILETLDRLDYVYPYHQVVGYYLEKAGMPEPETKPFKDLGLAWDFYLTHGLRDTEYVPAWRLHVPRGF